MGGADEPEVEPWTGDKIKAPTEPATVHADGRITYDYGPGYEGLRGAKR